MGLTEKKVYAILKKKIGVLEEQTRHPIRYKGSVNSALELPGNPEIGDMYNISQKSIYGEAGMNVAWNGVYGILWAPRLICLCILQKKKQMPQYKTW